MSPTRPKPEPATAKRTGPPLPPPAFGDLAPHSQRPRTAGEALAEVDRIEARRLDWLRSARGRCGALAYVAFAMPDSPQRPGVMHDRISDLAERAHQTPERDRAPWERAAIQVEEWAKETPYGFARYGGAILRSCLLDLPHVLDRLADDSEAMT